MDEPAPSVSLFINMGTDPNGPTVGGRQSRFYRYWSMANGGPPLKGQEMDWRLFIDKVFLAKIELCEKNSEGKMKASADMYSRIVDFERAE